MGHPSFRVALLMVKSGYGTLHGANVTADVIKAHKDDWCEGCALQDA